MTQLTVAFDIDGCLRNASDNSANMEVVILLQLMSKMKNTRIIVWSGGGKEYAEGFVNRYGLTKYVDAVYAKQDCKEHVDIAFDDQHAFALADKNLIVRMK